VEKETWGLDNAASEEMFESRIETFAEGTLLAFCGANLVGVIVTEIVNYDTERYSYSWYEITDNGFIKKSHNADGDFYMA